MTWHWDLDSQFLLAGDVEFFSGAWLLFHFLLLRSAYSTLWFLLCLVELFMYTDYYSFTAPCSRTLLTYTLSICLLCVYPCMCLRRHTEVRGNLWEWILPFHLDVDCRDWTQDLRLNNKCLYYLSHLAGPALVNIDFFLAYLKLDLLISSWWAHIPHWEALLDSTVPPNTCFSTFPVFMSHLSVSDIGLSIEWGQNMS